MVMPRISHLFSLFSGQPKHNVVGTANADVASSLKNHAGAVSPETSAGFVERRKIPGRRLAERRKVNCHPYLDTRTNNGRRRSFGRRATDEKVDLSL